MKSLKDSKFYQPYARYLLATLPFLGVSPESLVHAQVPGTLDQTFNTTGIQITNMAGTTSGGGNSPDRANTVLLRNDGYLSFGDASVEGGPNQVAIARYLNDGSLVQSVYSNESTAQTPTTAIDNLAIGASVEGWFIRSYNEDLSADVTFGTGGTARFTFDAIYGGIPRAVASKGGYLHPISQLPENRYVLAGDCEAGLAVVRLRLGVPLLDDTFSADGKMIIDIPGMNQERGLGVAIGEDGAIFIAGWGVSDSPIGGSSKGFVVKVINSGLDESWGAGGVQQFSILTNGGTIPPTLVSQSTTLWAITIDDEAKVLVCGQIRNDTNGNTSFFIARRQPDGSPDDSFGGPTGYSTIGYPGTASDIAIQPDGRIVVAGRSESGGIALARLEVDGTLDASFGIDGIVETLLPTPYNDAEVGSMIIANNRIVIAGAANIENLGGSTGDFLILRYLTGSYVGILEFGSAVDQPLIFPNPIGEATTLSYTLAQSERLTITLQDLQGKHLTTFMDGELLPAGEYRQVVAIPTDLASGNYLLLFSSPNGKMSVQVTK